MLMPQPMNRAAKRLGQASGTPAASVVAAPQTGSDSSHGSATATPAPRRNVRRVGGLRAAAAGPAGPAGRDGSAGGGVSGGVMALLAARRWRRLAWSGIGG